MTDTSRLTELPSAASHAKDIGQITAIEQARAVAEVQARVIVAQNNPRNIQQAITEMEMACKQKLLADRAFFNVPRGRDTITDVSIHLAKELARCWRNVDYEVAELRRDDEKGYSEMLAWAWDMEANNKSSIKFQVPHTRDMKTGSKRMNDINQIYELLANMGSRRVREMILKILPTWFVESAKALCYQTLEDGGGEPLPKRIAEEIKLFDRGGVTLDRIERRFGVKSDKWTPHHLAQLQVIRTSLHQRSTTVDQEFPPERITTEALPAAPVGGAALGVTVAQATANAEANAAAMKAATITAEPTDHATPEQLATLQEQMNVVGHPNLVAALGEIRVLSGRPDLLGAEALTVEQAAKLINDMAGIVHDPEPERAMDAAVLAAQENQT